MSINYKGDSDAIEAIEAIEDGVPMIAEDKEWIESQFNAKVSDIKLEFVRELNEAIGNLSCTAAALERQTNAGRIETIEKRMDNGRWFEDKLANLKNDSSNLAINKWRLIIAALSVAGVGIAAWSPYIVKFIRGG